MADWIIEKGNKKTGKKFPYKSRSQITKAYVNWLVILFIYQLLLLCGQFLNRFAKTSPSVFYTVLPSEHTLFLYLSLKALIKN